MRPGTQPDGLGFVRRVVYLSRKMVDLCWLEILPSPSGWSNATILISWFILNYILLSPWGQQWWKPLKSAQSTLNNEGSVFLCFAETSLHEAVIWDLSGLFDKEFWQHAFANHSRVSNTILVCEGWLLGFWNKKNGCLVRDSRFGNECVWVLLDVGTDYGGHLHHVDGFTFSDTSEVS
jgi:hypothetical protein